MSTPGGGVLNSTHPNHEMDWYNCRCAAVGQCRVGVAGPVQRTRPRGRFRATRVGPVRGTSESKALVQNATSGKVYACCEPLTGEDLEVARRTLESKNGACDID